MRRQRELHIISKTILEQDRLVAVEDLTEGRRMNLLMASEENAYADRRCKIIGGVGGGNWR